MFVSQTTMCLKLNTADSESNNTEQCDNKTNRNVCRAKRFAGKQLWILTIAAVKTERRWFTCRKEIITKFRDIPRDLCRNLREHE